MKRMITASSVESLWSRQVIRPWRRFVVLRASSRCRLAGAHALPARFADLTPKKKALHS